MAMVYCRGCGAQIDESAPTCPQCGAQQNVDLPNEGDYVGPRSFSKAIKICLSKYAFWQGRAPRSELWYWTLFIILVSIAADVVDAMVFGDRLKVLGIIAGLALALPGISVQVRRLHDLARSGWWYWILLIPVIGWIILLVWNCTQGTIGPNKYGADPLGPKAWPTPYHAAAG